LSTVTISKKEEPKQKPAPKIAPLPPKPGTTLPLVKPPQEPAPTAPLPVKYASAAAASLPPTQPELSRPNLAASLPISYEKLTHPDSSLESVQQEEIVVIFNFYN
jgi:hypothetical protein